jgi:hypothetical protein
MRARSRRESRAVPALSWTVLTSSGPSATTSKRPSDPPAFVQRYPCASSSLIVFRSARAPFCLRQAVAAILPPRMSDRRVQGGRNGVAHHAYIRCVPMRSAGRSVACSWVSIFTLRRAPGAHPRPGVLSGRRPRRMSMACRSHRIRGVVRQLRRVQKYVTPGILSVLDEAVGFPRFQPMTMPRLPLPLVLARAPDSSRVHSACS